MKFQIIKPVARDSQIYNAADKPGMGRGKKIIPGGRVVVDKNICLIYSVIGYEENNAICQSWDAFGTVYEERIPKENLISYSKNKLSQKSEEEMERDLEEQLLSETGCTYWSN